MAVVQAPAGAIDGHRRPLRLGHVLVRIEDLLIVTWRAPEASLRSRLPAILQPVTRHGEGFVSAVLFRNRGLRPALLGLPRFDATQMNLRSYVLDPATGETGSVFFHGLYLGRRWLAAASRHLLGPRFRHLPIVIRVRREGERVAAWEARSRDGSVRLLAHENGGALDAETLDLLTNPHTGYVADARGRLRRWSIWHRPQRVRTLAVDSAHVSALAGITLGAPISALYVDAVDYEVYLPAIRYGRAEDATSSNA
jgi:uncharacterized protein YqjF (DUF2071 family)